MRNRSNVQSSDAGGPDRGPLTLFLIGGALVLVAIVGAPLFYWSMCRFNVPTGYIAVLTKKTGKDLPNDEELAPSAEFKGLQKTVLAEGRHFYNPWYWDWDVVPQIEIPHGKCGVRVRLYGDDPPESQIIAWKENEKGIMPDVLRPGRYPINALLQGQTRPRDNYTEMVELHDPVTVPAGFKGVVTNLSSPLPAETNTILTEKGKRGVEAVSLGEGTYYVNPYVTRIDLVDCRSQRHNLADEGEMGFPSKDGFWVSLDCIIEFRIKPDDAAGVFVLFNEYLNNNTTNTDLDVEIVKKVVLPNARSFCRLRGSDHSGREFISGETRAKFQEDFQTELRTACESQGIEIVQALITKINPPQPIAEPVRARQIAIEQRRQFASELLQQESEKQLAIENEMTLRKQALVEAQKKVNQMTTEAEQAQEIALIGAQKKLKVAELELQASADLAAATLARGTADAKVVEFENIAAAAGWKKAVEAFDGNGDEYARWLMLKKLAPAFRNMMVNTADSPIMEIFQQYQKPGPNAEKPVSASRPAAGSN